MLATSACHLNTRSPNIKASWHLQCLCFAPEADAVITCLAGAFCSVLFTAECLTAFSVSVCMASRQHLNQQCKAVEAFRVSYKHDLVNVQASGSYAEPQIVPTQLTELI